MRGSSFWLALSWVAGGLVVGVVEWMALGNAGLSLVWVTVSLSLSLGLLCGLAAVGIEALGRALDARSRRPELVRALVRALVAAPPLFWVCAHLFDGALASTLPGASLARIWVPTLGVLGLAAFFWVAGRLARSGLGRAVLGLGLLLVLALAEYGNRTLFTSEYLDVHAFLTLVSVAAAGGLCWLGLIALATRGQGGRLSGAMERAGQRRGLAAGLAGLVLVNLVAVLFVGMEAREDRWLVATRGMHTRQLARVLRAALDLDGDGYARVLGGGDCDEGDAAVNPGADDIPEDGLDQDCDGLDAHAIATRVEVTDDERQTLEEWLDGAEVRALTERVRGYHMVFIVVDALRADVVAGAWSGGRAAEEFANLNALARESRYFSRAFAPASGTDYSVAGMLTSRVDPFVPVDTTLLEALAALGYQTHAVLPREVLRWACQPLITRGLASHDTLVTDTGKRDVGDHSTSAETTDLGLAFLDAHLAERPDTPAFLWLHYFDVHEHKQMGASDARLRQAAGHDGALDGPARYRALARVVDEEIGRLRAAFETRGLWERTVVVLLSDHGESLGEDARLPETHGRYVYNPLVHVPLAIRIPDVAPAVVERPVSLLDVAPTVLALLGREPLAGMEGTSLLPWLLDSAPQSARERTSPIPLNESDQHGVVAWPYKLMLRPADNLIELYDLAVDFAEENDLSSERPDVVQRLRAVQRSLPRVVVDRTLEARKRRDRIAGERPDNP